MEVLSLALLAAASGGLLAYKKKQKDDKKKKESFVTDTSGKFYVIDPKDDSLFAPSVVGCNVVGFNLAGSKVISSNGMPEIHNEYVQSATTKFNPLAALFNPSKVNFASNADSIYPSFEAPDNTTLQNMLQTSYTRNKSRDEIVLNDVLNQKNVSKYRIPNSSNVASLINTCELTPVVTTPEGADCSVFDSPLFSRQCGVCHKNAVGTIRQGSNSGDTNNLNVNGPYGLYVSPRLTTAVTEQINQRQTLASIGVRSEVYIPTPSLGQCGKDPDTNQSYFSLSKDMCVATNKFINCKTNQNFSNTACYQCSENNKYFFIDKTSSNLSKRQLTEFDIWGSGRVSIQMDDTMQYLTQPNSNNITSYQTALTYITLSSTRKKIILPFSSNSNISDNNSLEPADGKSLIINLSAVDSTAPTPYIQGLFLGVLPNGTVKTTDFAITATAIVNSNEVLPYVSGDPSAYKLYPQILNGRQSRTATFKILISYMYLDPSATEKNYCSGPFIRNPNVARKLNSLCYTSNDRPGNYSQECLQQLFLAAGCSNGGSNYPNDAATNSNLNGGSRNLGDITSYVTTQYNRAWSGKDANQSNLPMSEWQNSIRYCLDKNSVSTDPCDLLPESVRRGDPGADPISDQCIKYIYENSQNPISREGFVTYSNANARSLFDRHGLSNDRYCTEFGTISPMSNASNIALAQEYGRSNGGIAGIKQFYNNIHSKANMQNMTNAERNEFMQKCYGKTLEVPPNADPAIINGKQVAQTSCGVHARYVKLTHTDKHIMINQIFVIDARGQNVALNKTVTSSSLATGHSYHGAVDAVEANRFKSLNNGAQWCQIDLDGTYDIMKIIYYNTDIVGEMDQASGMQMILLNDNGSIINNSAKTLTNARVQFFDYTSSTASASCPSMYSGTRGDLFSPATRLVNLIVTQQGSYSVYKIEKPPTWQGIGTAEWIWNEPYAGGDAFAQDVTFTCVITNSTNVLKPYTFYYRASATPTILFNNVTQTVSGNDSSASTNPASISITLSPGDNIIQVTVRAFPNNAAGFIAAFSPGTGTTYENMTLGSWKSVTAPKLGSYYIPNNLGQASLLSPPSGSSTNNGSASLVQTTILNYPNIRSIWNQPDAWYGAATGTFNFFLSFVVTDAIKTYTLVSTPFNTSIESIVLNSKTVTTELPVVPGTNVIKVVVKNDGTTLKPAGIVLYIRDNNQGIIPETQNSTNWKVQGDTNWVNDPCLYVQQGTNLPFKCASNAFKNAGCTQPFSSAYNFTNMSLSNLLTEYTNNWASRTATSSANQLNCKGDAMCDTGSNLPFYCASKIFSNAGCTQPFTNDLYPDNFKAMTSNALLAEYTNNWASRTATLYTTENLNRAGSMNSMVSIMMKNLINQPKCRGMNICDSGYQYLHISPGMEYLLNDPTYMPKHNKCVKESYRPEFYYNLQNCSRVPSSGVCPPGFYKGNKTYYYTQNDQPYLCVPDNVEEKIQNYTGSSSTYASYRYKCESPSTEKDFTTCINIKPPNF
jgi:hypothetical protein